mgnify:CR=1 FL=1
MDRAPPRPSLGNRLSSLSQVALGASVAAGWWGPEFRRISDRAPAKLDPRRIESPAQFLRRDVRSCQSRMKVSLAPSRRARCRWARSRRLASKLNSVRDHRARERVARHPEWPRLKPDSWLQSSPRAGQARMGQRVRIAEERMRRVVMRRMTVVPPPRLPRRRSTAWLLGGSAAARNVARSRPSLPELCGQLRSPPFAAVLRNF